MFQCPSCGGNLKFNIPSQKLKCDSCMSEFDPYSIKQEKDAEESTLYDVTVFTCPQCGGEIMSTDTSAAEFCSFCGASTILTSRVSQKRRPGYIIPFQKSKDDCKQAYKKLIKRSLFAPKELSDERHIESFRGIYMPYWVYHIANNGPIRLSGSDSYRRGDYIYTDHYNLTCDINSYYKGISYDASSSFDDTLSENIAPYDARGMKEFTPSVLSGFYADVSDVDCNLYIEDAETISNNATFDKLRKVPAFKGVSFSLPKTTADTSLILKTNCREIDSAMFPVWFMSYRNKGRVAYAVVNGQTGKAAADIPVSIGKYFLGSLILALPIFLLLNMVFTVIPKMVLWMSCVLALITDIISTVELSHIKTRDDRLDDKGYLYKTRKLSRLKKKKPRPKSTNNKYPVFTKIFFSLFTAVFFLIFMVVIKGSGLLSAIDLSFFVLPGCFVATLVIMIKNFSTDKHIYTNTGMPTQLPVFIAVTVACLIRLWNPVSDFYYYGAVILVIISVLLTNIGIIQKHNVLATRRLPQFNRQGGDDRA